MTSAGFYKDRPAIRVDTGALTALFLPEDGGKLASLKARDGYEYLYQGPESRYRRLTVDGSYIEAECSGWDDMFPTIDPYQPEGLPPYPDHGEICRIPLEHIHGADSDLLRADSRLFPGLLFQGDPGAEGRRAVPALHPAQRRPGTLSLPVGGSLYAAGGG